MVHLSGNVAEIWGSTFQCVVYTLAHQAICIAFPVGMESVDKSRLLDMSMGGDRTRLASVCDLASCMAQWDESHHVFSIACPS